MPLDCLCTHNTFFYDTGPVTILLHSLIKKPTEVVCLSSISELGTTLHAIYPASQDPSKRKTTSLLRDYKAYQQTTKLTSKPGPGN